MITVIINGQPVDWATAGANMANDIREHLHAMPIDWTEQSFVGAYAALHYERFGETWTIN